MNGNIFARKERREQKEEVDDAIRLILGGDETAQELARRIFFLTGLVTYYGSERDKAKFDSQLGIEIHDIEIEGVPHSDARERIMNLSDFQQYKQGQGEWGGPDITIGRYPERIYTDLFRFVSIPNPEIDRESRVDATLSDKKKKAQLEEIDWKKRKSTRSLWELMWEGWDDKNALRLGEVSWKSYNNYFWKDHAIRLHFAGSEGRLFDTLTGTERVWRINNFLNVRWWRQHKTNLKVCLGPWAVTDGLNREWFEKNQAKIVLEAKKFRKDTETDEGAMEKAAKKLLDDQRQAVIDRTNEVLVDAIKWWWDAKIEDRPGSKVEYSALKKNMDTYRKRAGVLLPGESKPKTL